MSQQIALFIAITPRARISLLVLEIGDSPLHSPLIQAIYLDRTASAHTASGAMSISPGHESVFAGIVSFGQIYKSAGLSLPLRRITVASRP